MPVITPIIHLNGDRKETLVQNLKAAYAAVRNAQAVLQQCAPNGRNYYPEPGRFELALAQHTARQQALLEIRKSIEDEMFQIDKETR